MRAIRRTDTKPEVVLRSALHRRGYRFRKDYRVDTHAGRTRPDIVFTKKKLAVFVDGCFWHVCPEHGRVPDVNDGYWGPKLQRTVERDARNNQQLQTEGWTVLRIWEHEPLAVAVDRVQKALATAD